MSLGDTRFPPSGVLLSTFATVIVMNQPSAGRISMELQSLVFMISKPQILLTICCASDKLLKDLTG